MGSFNFLLKNVEKCIILSFVIDFFTFSVFTVKYFNFIKEKSWCFEERISQLYKNFQHHKNIFPENSEWVIGFLGEKQNIKTKQQTTPFHQQGLSPYNAADLFQGNIGLMILKLRYTKCSSKPLSFQMKRSNFMLCISMTPYLIGSSSSWLILF